MSSLLRDVAFAGMLFVLPAGAVRAHDPAPAGYAAAPRRLEMLGLSVTIRLGAADTEGRAGVLDVVVPANAGPPTHRHSREDEIFLIRAGAYEFLTDGRCLTAGPGDRVFLPRGHVHRYRNASALPAEHTLILMPAGLEQMFVDVAEEKLEMPRDFGRLQALSIERYGLEYLPAHDFGAPPCRVASREP